MDALERVLRWLGVPTSVRPDLERFADWLIAEAIGAGGLGPGEGPRVVDRHIVDSLLFAGVWSQPGDVLDVGSGVGLPGIPLAIIAPDRHFVLLDRSGRRVELAKRALRILQLENVEVLRGDVEAFDWSQSVVVSRASLSPERLRERVATAGPPRELLVAGSHRAPPKVAGFESVEISAEILDRPVWILRMAQS